jgi:hypothetical protein
VVALNIKRNKFGSAAYEALRVSTMGWAAPTRARQIQPSRGCGDVLEQRVEQNKKTVYDWLRGDLGLPAESGYNHMLRDGFWNELVC